MQNRCRAALGLDRSETCPYMVRATHDRVLKNLFDNSFRFSDD